MKTEDILYETYAALSANKARSGLTILGIVIGISSVIAMLSIGQGAQNSVQSSIQSIGSNLLIIMPGAQRTLGAGASSARGSARTLTKDDADALAQDIPEIKTIAPEVSSRYQVAAKGKNTNTQVIGTYATYQEVRNVSIGEGVFISDQDVKEAHKVAVLGPTTRDDLFGENASVVGETVRINGMNFKVAGITQAKGGSGFSNQDDVVYIPLSTAQRFLSGNEYVTTISIAAQDAESITTAQEKVSALLLSRHNIRSAEEADFSILNQADIIATASSVTQIFTVLLGSVAGISLVVGGIGIMNMMLTTVTERTREIGLRKAIGAKQKDISTQFLVESLVLTCAGGVIGLALGWLISAAMSYFNIIQTQLSVFSVVLAVGVSALIGIVFGYYPAKRAAKLHPIDALRYE